MTCGVSAVPEPTIEWLRGGFTLADNDTYHIYSLEGISLLEVCNAQYLAIVKQAHFS